MCVTGILRAAVLAVVGAMSLVAVPPHAHAAPTFPGYSFVGSDEFDGPAGSAPDPAFWDYDVGDGGWGNNEKQTYTSNRDNSRLDGNGRLLIEARRSWWGFTSARLVTRDKFEFTYGVVEARIKVPAGKGLHPAFWTLGSNIYEVGWPASGEIDILEVIGDGSRYHAGVHGPTIDGGRWERSVDGTIGAGLSHGFHDYALIKAPGSISVAIDRQIVGTVTTADLQPHEQWVFDAPAYLLLNVAVGGNWPGPVDYTTPFPATMAIDWVRFYQ